MLKHGLAFPERNLSVIEKRLDFVAALVKDTDAYDQMAHHLDAMVDIERIVAKIATQKISPRALVQLAKSLDEIDQINTYLSDHPSKVLKERAKVFLDAKPISSLIQSTKPEAPVLLSKGEVIADGVNSELGRIEGTFAIGQGPLGQNAKRKPNVPRFPP